MCILHHTKSSCRGLCREGRGPAQLSTHCANCSAGPAWADHWAAASLGSACPASAGTPGARQGKQEEKQEQSWVRGSSSQALIFISLLYPSLNDVLLLLLLLLLCMIAFIQALSAGYSQTFSASAQEWKHQIDLILLGLELPKTEGRETRLN